MASVRWSETGGGARPCRLSEALELAPGLDDLDGALGHARPAGHGEGKEMGRGVRLSQWNGAGAQGVRRTSREEEAASVRGCTGTLQATSARQRAPLSMRIDGSARLKQRRIYDSPNCRRNGAWRKK